MIQWAAPVVRRRSVLRHPRIKSGAQDEERRERVGGHKLLQKRSLPGYMRISFETERPPIFCGDRARGAS